MSIPNISFRATTIMPYQDNRDYRREVQQPTIQTIPRQEYDRVEIQSKAPNNESDFKSYSCKGADMLKYDLDYSKPSYFNRGYTITGDVIELSVKNKFNGAQNITGVGYGELVDVDVKSGIFSTRKGEVTGKINGKQVEIKYQANENAKSIKLSGNIDELDEKNKNLLIMLISDKLKYDLRLEQEAEMIAMATVFG